MAIVQFLRVQNLEIWHSVLFHMAGLCYQQCILLHAGHLLNYLESILYVVLLFTMNQ